MFGLNFGTILIFIMVIIALISCAFVTASVFHNIDKIGGNNNLKELTVSRALFNFYAIIILVFVMTARFLELIDSQLFIGLLIAVVGGLGIKISTELLRK